MRLLGPVRLIGVSGPVELGPMKRRAVLVILAVNIGQAVTIDVLIDRLWEQSPPEAARSVVHGHLSRIRNLLARVAAEEPGASLRLVRQADGYALDGDPDMVDLRAADRLLASVKAGGLADVERERLLRSALDLWRGTPLAGIPGAWAERVRQRLIQRQVDVTAEWGNLALHTLPADTVLAQLREVAAEHPLAEHLVAVEMRALHAVGRHADALDRFTVISRTFADQFGVDPGPELRGLHETILRDNVLAAPTVVATGTMTSTDTAVPSPAQLPLDTPVFVERQNELAQLDAVAGMGDQQPATVVLVSISGLPGIGKTALAVHWAHRVASRFDGQLYVNLRGYDNTDRPIEPTDAVRGFLESLSVPPQRIPLDAQQQTLLYRTVLANRRMLIVLDNALDAEQVRPLLPGTPGSVVLITSRDQLTGLLVNECARPLTLGPLTASGGKRFLTHRLGEQRVTAELSAAGEIVGRCAGLPLALSLVAARAALHPTFPLRDLARELDDVNLDALTSTDPRTDLRTAFSWSYRRLGGDAAAVFRLTALHPGPDIGLATVASIVGLSVPHARVLLDELALASLLEEPRPGRFICHDLIRAYAAELGHDQDSAERRQAAVHRMLDHYLHTAHAAALLLNPHRDPVALPSLPPAVIVERFDAHDQALAWFARECQPLSALLGHALQAGLDSYPGPLAWALTTYLERTGHWRDQVTAQVHGLTTVRRITDSARQAGAHPNFAGAPTLGRYNEADGTRR